MPDNSNIGTDLFAPRYRVRLLYSFSYFNDNFDLITEERDKTVEVEAYTYQQAQMVAWNQERRKLIPVWSTHLLSAEPRKIVNRKSWRKV